MAFNYFRLTLDRNDQELSESLRAGSDFVEIKLFSPQQLSKLVTVPGGIEGQIISGAFTATSKLAD
jgi:hypothetical protein